MRRTWQKKGSRPIHAWVGLRKEPIGEVLDIEDTALKQLENMAGLPFIHPHGLAIMPDVHAGKGATVGSVIATDKAIVPAAVGVDIGCGMVAVRTTLKASDLPESLAPLRAKIEELVPVGQAGHPKTWWPADYTTATTT
jgi:tRNA-splicing ligase RtcB